MSELIKIREMSLQYGISARALKYYEEMGLITSTRSGGYAYRLYDDAAVQRLEQILILRKLNISIKDIQRIFSTPGSEVVLEVLGKKVGAIDEEVALLHELKEIVLDFIRQIEQADFGKESDVKLLYDKAKEIETQLVNVDYNGNPSNVNRLLEVTDGSVFFGGQDIVKFDKKTLRNFRKRAQMVFQDPYSSLNPRLSVEQLISEPLRIHKVYPNERELSVQIRKLMDTVGLAQRLATSFPHELDGGRRQRIGVARALALNPEFIVLDEPVSALDVCIQAQILNLLQDLKDEFQYTYLFITHDLSVVRHISNRIAVMYLGKVIELAGHLEIFDNPQHPYTQALLSAIPVPKLDILRKGRIILEGDVPSPVNPSVGCRFYGRCPSRQADCLENTPELVEIASSHFLACYHPGIIAAPKHSAQ